jgi:uncharacterized membrane protein
VRNLSGSSSGQGYSRSLQTIKQQIAEWSRMDKMCVAVLAFLIILYIFYFSAFQIQRHSAFETSLDTLSVEQPIWNTLHGRFMRATYYPVTGETVTDFNDRNTDSLLGDHVQLSLLSLLIPYMILPKTETLFVVLSICVGLGAIPLYRITKRRLGLPWLALLMAVGYLFLPAVETNTGWDIHGASFLPPLLLAALDAAETGHYKTWWVLTLLAMGFREDLPIFVGWAMIWMAPRHLRKQALAMFGAGLVFSLASFFVIIPYFGGGGTPYIVRFFPLGTPITVQGIWSAISQLYFWQFDLNNLIAYNLRLGLPLLFLYFASAPAMLATAPLMLANSLSWYQQTQYPYLYHYSAPLISWIIVGSVEGFSKIASFLKQIRPALNWNGVIGVALATSILATHWMLGYTPLSRGFIWPESTGRESIANEFINMIPKGATVSAESHLGAHLAQYGGVRFFPDVRDASWLLLDTWYGSYPYYLPPESTQSRWDAIRQDPSWVTVAARDGLVLLEKGSGPPQNISDGYRIANPGQPEFNVQFGDEKRIYLVDISVIHHSKDQVTFCADWNLTGPGAGLYPNLQFLSTDNTLTQAPEYGINLSPEIFTQPGRYRICRRLPSVYFTAQRKVLISLETRDSTETRAFILDPGKWAPYLTIKNNLLEIDLTRLR